MSTVQLQMTKFYQRVDPNTDGGVEITTANVGTVDGQKFPVAKALAIYNEARVALANAISTRMDPFSKKAAVANNVVRNNAFQFTAGVATKETGYIENISLMTAAGVVISVMPAHTATLTRYLDSAVNPIVYEQATQFISESGSSFIPNASNYVHRYFGITAFTVTDITNGSSVETFSPIWEPVILELAEALATEQGLAQVNRLAITLVAPGGNNVAQ